MLEPEILKSDLHLKGWGSENWIANNDRYCLKILKFDKAAEFSMHYHIIKDETWYVYSGTLLLEYFDLSNAKRQSLKLMPGSIVRIPPNTPHKLIALTNAEIFEVSTQHFETDSYRIEQGCREK